MSASNGPFDLQANGTTIFVLYEYRPNNLAAIIFAIAFAAATIPHVLSIVWYKALYFIPFVLGGIFEALGYYGRFRSASQPSDFGFWAMQHFFTFAAVPFMAISLYLGLSATQDSAGSYRNRWLSRSYVVLSVAVLISQFANITLVITTDAQVIAISQLVILWGLIVQISMLLIYFIDAWNTRRRATRDPTMALSMASDKINWVTLLRGSEISALLLIVRSSARLVEYLQGQKGFLASNEAFVYALDASIVLLVMLLMMVYHPGRLVRCLRKFA